MIEIKNWKYSTSRKVRKIHKKAVSIISRNLHMEDLEDMMRLKELQNKFPTLRIKSVAGGNLSIRSKKDSWLVVNDGRFLALYHADKFIGLRKNTEGYHIQDVFFDIDFLLASIVSHDQYKLNNKRSSISDIKSIAFG